MQCWHYCDMNISNLVFVIAQKGCRSFDPQKKGRKIKPKYRGDQSQFQTGREKLITQSCGHAFLPRHDTNKVDNAGFQLISVTRRTLSKQPNYFLASCADTLFIDGYYSMCLWFCSFRASRLQAANEWCCLMLPLSLPLLFCARSWLRGRALQKTLKLRNAICTQAVLSAWTSC